MKRRLFDRLFLLAAASCAAVAVGVIGVLLLAILARGLPAVDWAFLSRESAEAGASGGIVYHLIGTAILVATAGVVSAPVAVGVALTRGCYLPPGRRRRALDLALYVLNGVPAILFGIAGFVVFVNWLGWGKSWLAGGVLLGLMILPTVTVSVVERIKAMPAKYTEAARGLGLSRSQVVRSVVLPQSLGGLVTGLLLGLARAAGETAPIMFTAVVISGVTVPDGVVDNPVLALPYHIFDLAQDSHRPEAKAKVWGAAVVLLGVVFLLSAAALPVRLKVHEEARHG